jgi:enterochelin esterase-like enzyme
MIPTVNFASQLRSHTSRPQSAEGAEAAASAFVLRLELNMKKTAICMVALVLAGASAQIPGADVQGQRSLKDLTRAAGRSENIPPFAPVEYGKDGSVTFHMYAPAAKTVELIGEIVTISGRDSVPMTCDARGVWSATISGVRPELSSYLYMVDGAPVMDQRNPGTKVGPRGNSNRFDMPGSPDFYAPQNGPHGKVEINWHRSTLLNETRPLWIYTPPAYAANTAARYPVLYLLHGSGDLESGWVEDGRANFILDNLIAARKAKPMIIVMPRGHVFGDRQIEREKNNEMLEQVLVREIIPFVDANYRVLAGRENRAIAGLSMGGGQTLRFGLHNLDRFAWVIGLSPAVMYSPAELAKMFGSLIANPKESNQLLKLLMIRCGTKDHLLDASDNFAKFLAEHGIQHKYERTDYERLWPGRKDDHTWPIWRMDLQTVVPLLFQ